MLFCFFACTVASQAQEAEKKATFPAEIELIMARSLWFHTGNASGLAITPLNKYAEVAGKYVSRNGDFRFRQEGESENDILFNTNGAVGMKGTNLWGNFTFSNTTVKDSRFNTMLYDPFRDMPFYVADPVSSEWKKQRYDLNLKAASPFFREKLAVGLQMDYNLRTSAKQNDPRSTSYYHSFHVNPGIVFKLNASNYIGLNGQYESMFERVIPTNSNSQQDQPVFVMRGLGNYFSGTVGGIGGIDPFYYKSNKIGGGFQYGYHGSVEIVADLNYQYRVEEAFQTPSKPQRMGSTKQQLKAADLQFFKPGEFSQKIHLNLKQKSTDGIEYVLELDTDYDVRNWIVIKSFIRSNYDFSGSAVNYSLYNTNAQSYDWQTGISLQYSDINNTYLLPRSELSAQNLFVAPYFKRNISISDRSEFLIGINGGYNFNLDGNFSYNGADPNSIVIQEFYNKDFAHITSDYIRAGASAIYSRVLGKSLNAFFVSADLQYLKPIDVETNRIHALISLGFTF